MEVREGEELGLAVAALDLALHGGEHLLGLARDPVRLEEEDLCAWRKKKIMTSGVRVSVREEESSVGWTVNDMWVRS